MRISTLSAALFLTVTLAFTGCSPQAQSTSPSGSATISTVENTSAGDQSYYSNFESRQEDQNNILSGTYYQNKSIKGLVSAEVLTETSLPVTGMLKCTKGSIKLIFQEPDGTETTLLECKSGEDNEETAVDLTVTAPAGKSVFYFTGTNSVCDFNLTFSRPEHVSYYLSTGNLAGL